MDIIDRELEEGYFYGFTINVHRGVAMGRWGGVVDAMNQVGRRTHHLNPYKWGVIGQVVGGGASMAKWGKRANATDRAGRLGSLDLFHRRRPVMGGAAGIGVKE